MNFNRRFFFQALAGAPAAALAAKAAEPNVSGTVPATFGSAIFCTRCRGSFLRHVDWETNTAFLTCSNPACASYEIPVTEPKVELRPITSPESLRRVAAVRRREAEERRRWYEQSVSNGADQPMIRLVDSDGTVAYAPLDLGAMK